MARISTHVLDIAKGAPAAGIRVELYFSDECVQCARTNPDGRTDAPMLTADPIAAGIYELVFHVEDYLRAEHPGQTPFFDRIAIRFAVSGPERSYHVPLLLAPHGYSTYRGS